LASFSGLEDRNDRTSFSYFCFLSITTLFPSFFSLTYFLHFASYLSYGRLLESLAQSGLAPAFLSLVTEKSGQPYAAQISGSVLGYIICIIAYFYPALSLQLYNVCMLFAFLCYLSQCWGYWIVTTRLASIHRSFLSPFGIFGAVYAAAVFSIGVLSVIAFQNDGGFSVIAVILLITCFTIYYYAVVVSTQKFSPDESTIMFKAYVVNANLTKRRRDKGRELSSVFYSFLSKGAGGLLGSSSKIISNSNQSESQNNSSNHKASENESYSEVKTNTRTQKPSSSSSSSSEHSLQVFDRDDIERKLLANTAQDDTDPPLEVELPITSSNHDTATTTTTTNTQP